MTIPVLNLVDPRAESPRRPWLKFFPSDWLGDERLAMCSLGAKGLLAAFMCLMHKAVPYGYLLINGKPPADAELARLVGAQGVAELRKLRGELLDHGVLSVAADGTMYSRRMVRTARRSVLAREAGLQGGNPKLRPLTVTDTPPLTEPLRVADAKPLTGMLNTQKPEARSQTPQPPPGALCDGEIGELAAEFLRRYPVVYARCRSGAFYRVKEARDFPSAVQLVQDYRPLDRLEAMLEVFLRRTDTGEMGRPGSPRQFQHYAPDCDRALRENGR